MAASTYLSAPGSLHVVLEHRWRLLPAVLLANWFSVDGVYALYWSWRDPRVLELMRDANFPASLVLYGIWRGLVLPGQFARGGRELAACVVATRLPGQKRSPSRK